jgi:PhnB protein
MSGEPKSPVRPIPDGYHALTPYLIVDGAARAIDWYVRVFAATELFRIPGPDGKVGHAELRIGDSMLMLADAFPQMGAVAPAPGDASSVSLMVYVPDCDAVFARAVEGGAKVLRPLATQFYGDRNGTFSCPFGHKWTVGTHVEDVPPDELARRAAAQQG